MQRQKLFAAALAVAAAALAGCGGGSKATGANPGDGKQIFTDAGCAGCHAFEAAGSKGGSGPELTRLRIPADTVALRVREGGGGMPAFADSLTEQQIKAVSEFVAANDGSQPAADSDSAE